MMPRKADRGANTGCPGWPGWRGDARRQAALSEIEHGKKEMGLATLVLVAAAVGIPLAYFSPAI